MRLRRRDDLFRNRNKFASFAYKWALRLSYPIRRPLVFFPVLLLLFLAPTFAGVKPAEVHLWYWNKAKSGVMFVVDGLKGLWGKTEIDMSFIKSPFETRGLNRLAESSDNRPRSSKRQAFGQAAGVPQGVDVMKQAESGDIVVPVSMKKAMRLQHRQQSAWFKGKRPARRCPLPGRSTSWKTAQTALIARILRVWFILTIRKMCAVKLRFMMPIRLMLTVLI